MMMKYLINILLVVSLFGCNYLDVVPENDIETIESNFEKRESADKWFKYCHTFLSTYSSSVLNNPAYMATDEVVAGDYTRQFPLSLTTFHGLFIGDGLQMAQSPFGNIWDKSAAYCAIRYCNTFLEKIGNVYNMEEHEKVLWSAEIKALKAHYYFELLRRYGPVILSDENIDANAGIEEMQKSRRPVDEVVEEIVRLLDEAIKDLPARNMKEFNRWAYHSLESAITLKAMTLFYAASPLFNGNPAYVNFKNKDGEQLFNPTYDPEKWKRAALAIDTALMICEGAGRRLIPPTTDNLRDVMWAIEESSLAKGFLNDEAIFMTQYAYPGRQMHSWTAWTRPLFQDGESDYNNELYGCVSPSMKMVEMYYTENGLPINEDRTWDYTGRYQLGKEADARYKQVVSSEEEVLNLHLRREPRFYAHIAADRCYFQRGTEISDKNDIVRAYQGERWGTPHTMITSSEAQNLSGYWMKKGSRSTISNLGYKSGEFNTEEACVLMRMADLYLMRAEAWNEYLDAPDEAHVYAPLNKVRERANIPGVEEAWEQYSRNPGKVKTKAGMREIIRQEWNVEFAFEGRRFWNLRRWLIAENELNSKLYGWNIIGKTARQFYNNFDGPVVVWAKRKFIAPRDYLFPIRSEEILISGCVQNPNW